MLTQNVFSMLGKIETQSRSLLSPSTVCDLLTVKLNHDAPCYSSDDLFTDKLLQEAKSATHRSLERMFTMDLSNLNYIYYNNYCF